MANIPETLLKHRLFIAVLIVFVLSVAGCISQQPEILKVIPVIDYNPLEGFYEAEGMFTVLKGSVPEVKESLKDIVIKKAPQQSTFSIDDDLNFVVFRGVFNSGGYGIDIDRVEKQGNAFTVYATYIDPGEGIVVGAMVTQPVAIIPIGRLAVGDYEVRLRVKKVKADADGTKIVRKVVEPEKELSAFNFKVKPPEEGIESNTLIPNIIIGVDSYNPPAYRGNSTLVTLAINGINVTKGTEISMSYKTQIWRADGSWEESPESVHLTPEQKPLVFQRTVKAGEPPEKLYYNLTVNIDKRAAEGDYYITISGKGKDRDSAFGSAVLSFKIGKGRKSPLQDRNVWNIGYTKDMLPPLSEEGKTEAVAIVINASYLKGKRYEIAGVSSGFYELENFSGFFPVVTADIGEPEKPGSIMSYIIDMEEKKVLRCFGIPIKPFPLSQPCTF